jgi:hypothetical protein
MARWAGPLFALGMIAAAAIPAQVFAQTSDDLASAFAAAFGGPAPITRTVDHQHPLSDSDQIQTPQRELRLTPAALAPLGGDRYALIVTEVRNRDPDCCVCCVYLDAIAFAYLRRVGDRWKTEEVWPEFAWIESRELLAWHDAPPEPPPAAPSTPAVAKAETLETLIQAPPAHTAAADIAVHLDFGPSPLVLVADKIGPSPMIGLTWEDDWVIRLGPQAPQVLGQVPIQGGKDDGCPSCVFYNMNSRYSGRIGPPAHRNDLLSVFYKGQRYRQPGGQTAGLCSIRIDYAGSSEHLVQRPPNEAVLGGEICGPSPP